METGAMKDLKLRGSKWITNDLDLNSDPRLWRPYSDRPSGITQSINQNELITVAQNRVSGALDADISLRS